MSKLSCFSKQTLLLLGIVELNQLFLFIVYSQTRSSQHGRIIFDCLVLLCFLLILSKIEFVMVQVCLACLLPLFLVPIINILPLLFDFIMVSAIFHIMLLLLYMQ